MTQEYYRRPKSQDTSGHSSLQQPKAKAQTSSQQTKTGENTSAGTSRDRRRQSRAKQARRKRNRRIRRIVCFLVIVILVVCAVCYHKFRTYDSYSVSSTLDITSTASINVLTSFSSGYVKITESGVVFFNKKGEVWSESYDMTQPVYDICKGYLAVADMKQSEVYLFNKDGLVGIISAENSIIDVEVSKAGVVACATDDDEANYIEVYDKAGDEILTARSVFSSSGYLADITLSVDGTRLAAAYINVDLLDIVSRVVFYDFSLSGQGDDLIVGGFSQYTDTVLTNVEFISEDRVIAVGDNAYTVYDFSKTPEIVYEDLELEYTIKNVIFGDGYFALITGDPTEEYNYMYIVYDKKGEIAAQAGFDFSYTEAQFFGRAIMLTSENACHIYTFDGRERFSCAFEESIAAMCPAGYASLVFAQSSQLSFIRMK